MSGSRWTLSSVLSVSRIVLIAPVAWLLLSGRDEDRPWAAALIGIAVLTDFLDGYLARRLRQVTELGKVIDPLADKIAVAAVFVVLMITGEMEWWLVAIVIVRDILLLAGALFIRRRKGIIVQSNWPGKVAVTAMAVVALLTILPHPSLVPLRTAAVWFTVAMVVLSFGLYARRLFIGAPRHRGGTVA